MGLILLPAASYWMKKARIKARGVGLGFTLKQYPAGPVDRRSKTWEEGSSGNEPTHSQYIRYLTT